MRPSAKQKCFTKDELRKQHATKVSQEGLVTDHEGEAEKSPRVSIAKAMCQATKCTTSTTNQVQGRKPYAKFERTLLPRTATSRWKTVRACMCLVSERSVVCFTAECAKFSLQDFSTISTTSTEEKMKKEKILCLLIWLDGACDNGDARMELAKSGSRKCLKFESSQERT